MSIVLVLLAAISPADDPSAFTCTAPLGHVDQRAYRLDARQEIGGVLRLSALRPARARGDGLDFPSATVALADERSGASAQLFLSIDRWHADRLLVDVAFDGVGRRKLYADRAVADAVPFALRAGEKGVTISVAGRSVLWRLRKFRPTYALLACSGSDTRFTRLALPALAQVPR